MSERTSAPDISQLEIPMDRWTEPFWQAAARKELKLPRCKDCTTFRWPPGPFCPSCRCQEVEWISAGPARLYSYTLVRRPGEARDSHSAVVAPGLVEFPKAGGVRIMAAIVDTPPDAIRIGVPLVLGWTAKGDTNVPVFSLA